jgi:hypothetical protein
VTETHLPPNWIQRVCAILNVHGWLTGQWPHQAIRFFTAWQRAEGGTAAWNPLNATTHVYAGVDRNGRAWQSSSDFNAVHVSNYNRPVDGVMATASTLLNGNFNPLVGALQNADSGILAEQLVEQHRAELQTWGTDPDLMLQVLKTTP